MFNVCFIDVIIRQLNQNTWTFEYSFKDYKSLFRFKWFTVKTSCLWAWRYNPYIHTYIHRHTKFCERHARVKQSLFSPWVAQSQGYKRDHWWAYHRHYFSTKVMAAISLMSLNFPSVVIKYIRQWILKLEFDLIRLGREESNAWSSRNPVYKPIQKKIQGFHNVGSYCWIQQHFCTVIILFEATL